MVIENSPLRYLAQEIIASGQTQTNFGWEARVHLKDQMLTPLMVISVNVARDYAKNFTDQMTCTFLFPLGKYARRIYPGRNDLEITLYKIPLLEVNSGTDTQGGIEAERYSAILLDQGPSPVDAKGTETNDEDVLDLTQLVEVHFQLFNKAVEQIRLISVGGVYRQTKVEELLTWLLTNESMKVDVDDQRAIEGIDVAPAANERVYEQVVITHGTKLIDAVDYLQQRIGVYNAGIGHYIQGKHWYVYPLYNPGMFNDSVRTITLVVLPSRKFTDIERTYRKIGDSLTVLVTGDTGFKDDSGSQYLNSGNGARYTEATGFMEGSATTKDNKAVMARGKNNSEFVTDTMLNEKANFAPVPQERITANPFPILSKLNARNGGAFKAVWQNSDPQLILPGMVTRIIYSDNGETKELFGVMLSSDSVSHKTGDFGSRKFSNQTILSVFVNRSISAAS